VRGDHRRNGRDGLDRSECANALRAMNQLKEITHMRIHTAVLAFFILAGLRGFAADSPDADFVRDAAKGGQNEVEMGKMGLQKATDQGTKTFAQRLIDDHSKMNEELRLLAQKKSIAVPDAQKDDRAMMEKMANKSGIAFDRSFAHHAVKDHEKDVAAFDNEAKNGQDPDVKAFAAKYSPTLRDHLKMAQDLSDKLGKGAALNDPDAEAAQNVTANNENAETAPIDYEHNPAVTIPEPAPAPAPVVRDIEREPVNTADNSVVRAPINTAGEAVKNPVDTSVNVAGNTVNKGVDMATHPIHTAKDAVTHPIRTAKNIITAPFKSNRENRDYVEYREDLNNRNVERSDFRDDGYRSDNVNYERDADVDATECGACGVHESRCESCGGFSEPVYDNDFKATETSIIRHADDCDSCR